MAGLIDDLGLSEAASAPGDAREPRSATAPLPRPPLLTDDLNLSAAEPPGLLSRVATAATEAVTNLANLPRLVTEGVPAAARAFVEAQAAPTVGQALRQSATTEAPVFGGEPRRPSFAEQVLFGGMSPIPGLLDLGERALRAPVSLGRAVAELGPERAKPLTEALATGAMLLPPRAAATALATDVRGLMRPPVAPRPQLALPPGPIVLGPGARPATPAERLLLSARQQPAPSPTAPRALPEPAGLSPGQRTRRTPRRPYEEPPTVLEAAQRPAEPSRLVDDLGRPVEAPPPAAEASAMPAPTTVPAAEAPAVPLRSQSEILQTRFNLPGALGQEEEVRRTAVAAERAITEALRTGDVSSVTLSGRLLPLPENAPFYARAAVGGLLGGSIGDTPEERVRNALIGAGLGVVASGTVAKRIVQAVRDDAGAIKPGRGSVGQRLREQIRKGKTLDQSLADEGMAPTVRPAPATATTTAAKSAPPKPLLTEEAALRIEQEAGVRLPGDLKGRRLSTETTGRVVSAAEQAMREAGIARDPEVPITLQIVTTMTRQPELYGGLKRALDARGSSLDDLAEMFMATASNAGRQLQQLSAVQQRLAAVPELRALSQALGRAQPPMSGWEIAGHWWSRFVNIWRGSIVSALSTTVRNIESQAVRFPLATLEKSVEGTLQKMFRLGPESERGLEPAIRHVMDTVATLVRKDRRGQAEAILRAFPDEADELFYRWASDVEMATKTSARGGIIASNVERVLSRAEDGVKLVNVLNRGQEFFTRKVAFRVKLAETLRKRGVDVENIAPGQVTAEEVAGAVNHALEMTYSQTPKSGLAKSLLDLYANPLGKSLSFLLPFPRFMMNSWRFLFDYNATGFLKLLSQAERQKIAAGDTSTISKAVVGSGLLLTAWQVRNSEHAGEHWYEVKAGDRRIDMRPFAPFAQYLFIAELGKRLGQGSTIDKTTARELASGLLPSFRAGAGMFALDEATDFVAQVMRGGDVESKSRQIRRFAGEVAGGFLQPLTTFRELFADYGQHLNGGVGDIAAEEAKLRDVREQPFLGPIKRRVPGVSQTLPERELPLRGETPTQETVNFLGLPLSRQLSGISPQTRTTVEAEVARLGLSRLDVEGATTGEPKADRLILKHMGPIAERVLARTVAASNYAKLSDAERRVRLVMQLRGVREAARARAAKEDPALFKQIRLRRSLPPVIQELLQERGRLPAGVMR